MLRLNPKQILEKSIKSGINMKFTDFIKFNTINLNESYVDTFFHNLQSDIPIYMSEQMIEYFGYKGTKFHQIESVKKIITRHLMLTRSSRMKNSRKILKKNNHNRKKNLIK